jgi:hypothetical protein
MPISFRQSRRASFDRRYGRPAAEQACRRHRGIVDADAVLEPGIRFIRVERIVGVRALALLADQPARNVSRRIEIDGQIGHRQGEAARLEIRNPGHHRIRLVDRHLRRLIRHVRRDIAVEHDDVVRRHRCHQVIARFHPVERVEHGGGLW